MKKMKNIKYYFTVIKRWYLIRFYKACLRDVLFKILKGEEGLEVARRFFNYKIYQLSKSSKT